MKYESHTDDTYAICPYCKYAYRVENDEYAFEERVELCDSCGKHYFLEAHVDLIHRTSPNCELNGDDHDWEDRPTHKVCRVCGKVAAK